MNILRNFDLLLVGITVAAIGILGFTPSKGIKSQSTMQFDNVPDGYKTLTEFAE